MLSIFFWYSRFYSLDVLLLKIQILQIPSKVQGTDFVNMADKFTYWQIFNKINIGNF